MVHTYTYVSHTSRTRALLLTSYLLPSTPPKLLYGFRAEHRLRYIAPSVLVPEVTRSVDRRSCHGDCGLRTLCTHAAPDRRCKYNAARLRLASRTHAPRHLSACLGDNLLLASAPPSACRPGVPSGVMGLWTVNFKHAAPSASHLQLGYKIVELVTINGGSSMGG